MKKLCIYGDLVNNDINLTRVYPALKWLVTSEGDRRVSYSTGYSDFPPFSDKQD